MIYKLIVNAAFLAVGYYIGKEVAKKRQPDEQPERPLQSSVSTAPADNAQDQAGKGSRTIN